MSLVRIVAGLQLSLQREAFLPRFAECYPHSWFNKLFWVVHLGITQNARIRPRSERKTWWQAHENWAWWEIRVGRGFCNLFVLKTWQGFCIMKDVAAILPLLRYKILP
jgi:hypothetical protein